MSRFATLFLNKDAGADHQPEDIKQQATGCADQPGIGLDDN